MKAYDVARVLRSTYTTRWHANADLAHIRETTGEHQARVAMLVFYLAPKMRLRLSPGVVFAALHHDTGEMGVGDVAGPAKRKFPALADAMAEAEEASRLDMGVDLGCLGGLSDSDVALLEICDRLAAYAHVAHVRPDLLARDGWRAQREAMIRLGHNLSNLAGNTVRETIVLIEAPQQ